MVLDWPAAPKTARAGPHRAPQPARTREQDAPDTTKLCGALRLNERLTNPRTAQVERAVAPQNATAHSAKRGALRRAAPIVGAPALDPRAASQLAGHGGSFGVPQDTV
ncbi:trans-sialidase [Trypanosoma cruzi]|nr:trans-sialidase [Trypanosoma cruzi]